MAKVLMPLAVPTMPPTHSEIDVFLVAVSCLALPFRVHFRYPFVRTFYAGFNVNWAEIVVRHVDGYVLGLGTSRWAAYKARRNQKQQTVREANDCGEFGHD